MASPMVTSLSAQPPLDPLRQGKYTVHLADGLISKPRSSGSYSTVRYNYKPKQNDDGARRSTINSAEGNGFTLTLEDASSDGDVEHLYSGKRKNLKRSFALIFDQSNHSCVLEPLSSAYTFNVQSTPGETSAARLAAKYPTLRPREESSVGDDTLGADSKEVDPNGSADEENPFDYRHYLSATQPSSRSISPDPTCSAANTPLLGASHTTTVQRPQLNASNTKRPQKQLGSETRKPSPPVGTTLSKSRVASAPTVRLGRRASTRPSDVHTAKKAKVQTSKPVVKSAEFIVDSSDDDDEPAPTTEASGLEIEYGTQRGRPVHSHSRRGFGLSGASMSGPISLKSAASSANASPAHGMGTSFGASRKVKRPEVIDFGDISAREDDGSYDEDDEGDDDIESINLGSPAHERSNSAQDSEDDAMLDSVVQNLQDDVDAQDHRDADGESDMDANGEIDGADFEAELMQDFARGDESEESEEE